MKPYDQLVLHYDDSSDEEGNDSPEEMLARFADKAGNDPVLSEEGSAVSFENYRWGSALYNASQVRQRYAALKRDHLHGGEIPTEKTFETLISDAISEMIWEHFTGDDDSSAAEAMAEKCQTFVEEEINALQEVCLQYFRPLIRSIKYAKPYLPQKIELSLEELLESISGFISKKCSYENLENQDLPGSEELTADAWFEQDPERIEWIYNNEIENICETHNPCRKNKKLLTKIGLFSTGKDAKKILQAMLNDVEYSEAQREYLQELHDLAKAESPGSFLKRFKASYLKGRLQQLIDDEEGRGFASILRNGKIRSGARLEDSYLHDFDADDLDCFMPWTIESFRESLIDRFELENFSVIFSDKIEKKLSELDEQHKIYRTSLPSAHVYASDSVVDYIASLRLTNRSVIRVVRNQAHESILGKGKEEHHHYSWRFKASARHHATERTRITAQSRTGFVVVQVKADAYTAHAKKIMAFSLRNITDKHLAFFVRNVLQGESIDFQGLLLKHKEKEDVIMFVVQLAHLLGGTECMRYPGALIQVQMVLDLIAAGHLKWREAFGLGADVEGALDEPTVDSGSESDPTSEIDSEADFGDSQETMVPLVILKTENVFFPMIVEGALPVVRSLMTTYGQFANHKYHYPGNPKQDISINNPRVASFIEAEQRLSNKWFSFFKATGETTVGEAIKRKIPQWYPGVAV